MILYFNTVNTFKADEVKVYLEGSKVDLRRAQVPIQEILSLELTAIVKDKVRKVYEKLGVPCAVEHGGISLVGLNSLPGGLSKVVWDAVGDKLANFISPGDSREAHAMSVVGYCDGRRIHLFEGVTKGTIAERGRGEYKFQWDPIFIPEGDSRTFGEMGFPEKRKYSQAAKAWAKLVQHLRSTA